MRWVAGAPQVRELKHMISINDLVKERRAATAKQNLWCYLQVHGPPTGKRKRVGHRSASVHLPSGDDRG